MKRKPLRFYRLQIVLQNHKHTYNVTSRRMAKIFAALGLPVREPLKAQLRATAVFATFKQQIPYSLLGSGMIQYTRLPDINFIVNDKAGTAII